MTDVMNIPVCDIVADWSWNIRQNITDESVGPLALSIQENGLDYPITVRPLEEGKYGLVVGFRRFRAVSRVLGLTEIKCFVIGMTEEEARLANWRENGEREQLTFWDEVLFVKDTFPKGATMSHIQRSMNKPYDWVRPRRQIWDLPKTLIQLAEEGVYSARNIGELLKRDPAHQQQAAKQADLAKKRGENAKTIRKGSMIRRHVQGRKNMAKMMNIIEEQSLCSDSRIHAILLWASGDLTKAELAKRLKVKPGLFGTIEE